MERYNYKCKLCSRKFSNGKALGGHMRSHLTILPIPPKTHQLSNRTESTSYSSSSSSSEDEIIQQPEEEEEEEEEEKGGLVYGLRENPKRSFRFVDPEFSFTVDAGFVVQDRESETESSRNPTRKRSKRTRKLGLTQNQVENLEKKKAKLRKFPIPSLAESSQTEPEPVSSVSDTSPEEDVAMCLMMLSRDIWDDKSNDNHKFCFEKYYKCETCNKVFPTFQALGGHRSASHKKIMRRRRRSNNNNNFQDDDDDQTGESRNEAGKFIVVGVAAAAVAVDNVKKVHECPFCDKVFGSGQALGGHKKSHYLKSKITTTTTTSMAAKVGECLIDLNLPASMEDEVSAVSYAGFS